MNKEISKFVGSKIREFRKKRGLTQKELGVKIGVKHNTISSYEKGTNEPEQNILYLMANVLGVSINDFFPSSRETEEPPKKKVAEVSQYPFLPVDVAAGLPEMVDPITEDDIEVIEMPDALMGKWAGRDDIYIMRVNGESMNKTIPNSSLIAIKQTDISNLENGDIVVYSNHHEYSVKKFYKLEDKFIFRPHSTDINFTDYHVPFADCNELKIHGKVVMYIVNLD
ncbi:LexA family protein [Virgibacillus pantothenticus]|uniref:XRE family transcriptional regulator n=1 Tax=Virgibacillus pantothenticus TaxID=1473 RepID=A0A0L0QKP7_VIRPA|nr:XRE family transcriptional regulator [Virgibacillus pantothenticus]KNE19079.1 XRE family transcriptional regulator [Virgibacillus pantothenticus]MED3737246.1 XRE family transcriptional regulator [Virgibacillus pantothenticus]QTY15530.1 helix-turn-helix domain-containing protein [Virgibacillus pantothenticus]SIT00330.1 repressor LexA [Virgibacillus pantothenticus]